MANMILSFLLLTIGSSALTVSGTEYDCPTPQYLKQGLAGAIIECTLPDEYYGVYWHDKRDSNTDELIVSYQDGNRDGVGYNSGEFNITNTGLLQIKVVTVDHEHEYEVLIINKDQISSVKFSIVINVYVKPLKKHPVIDVCQGEQNCLITVKNNTSVSCSVEGVRPASTLEWYKQNEIDETILQSSNFNTPDGSTFFSFTKTNVTFTGNSLLELLVCKSFNRAPSISNGTAMVLFELSSPHYRWVFDVSEYGQVNKEIVLQCVGSKQPVCIWKKRTNTEYETLAYTIDGSSVVNGDYKLSSNGSLVMSRLGLQHEGGYACICGTSGQHIYRAFTLQAVVVPSKAVPQIKECSPAGPCNINIQNSGYITCSLNGVRPQPNLEFVYAGNRTIPPLVFTNQPMTVQQHGDVYDVTLKSHYEMTDDPPPDEVVIVCRVTTAGIGRYIKDARASLHSGVRPSASLTSITWVIIPVAVAIAIVVSAILCIIIIFICIRRRRTKNNYFQSDMNMDEENKRNTHAEASNELQDDYDEEEKEEAEEEKVPLTTLYRTTVDMTTDTEMKSTGPATEKGRYEIDEADTRQEPLTTFYRTTVDMTTDTEMKSTGLATEKGRYGIDEADTRQESLSSSMSSTNNEYTKFNMTEDAEDATTDETTNASLQKDEASTSEDIKPTCIVKEIEKLEQPYDVLTLGKEIIILMDNQIKSYTWEGKTVKKYQKKGFKPFAGAACNGKLYVTDKASKSIVVFDSSLNLLHSFGTDHVDEPGGITFCEKKNWLLVLNGRTNSTANISVFNIDETYEKDIGSNELVDPWHIKCNNRNELLISDCSSKDIKTFDIEKEILVKTFSTNLDGTPMHCRGLAVDQNNTIYVAVRAEGFRSQMECIVTYNVEGDQLKKYLESPPGNPWVKHMWKSVPLGRHIDSIAEDVFSVGRKSKGLSFARGVHFTERWNEEYLFVVDAGNKRVLIIELK